MATNEFDITDLLTSKSFEELTETERALAIAELGSEEAYREMYDVVQGTADLDAPKVTSSNREKTFDAFDELHEKPTKKRGIIWLKPFVIGLAAASILGFIWIIGFSDLNKEHIAENKPQPKKEVKDTTTPTEPVKEIEVAEESEIESEPTAIAEETEEIKTLVVEDFTLEAVPTALDDSDIIAEKESVAEAKAEKDKAESIIKAKTLSQGFIEEKLAKYQDEHNNEYNDVEISMSEAQGVQPANNLESASSMRLAKKESADAPEINMNSTISKKVIFKVKLPLHNHYTSY